MNTRAIVISLIVLVLIAGTYYVVLNREVQRSNIEVAGIGEKLFPDLKLDDIEQITLTKGDTEVVLARNEKNEWIVSTYYDYRADSNNVDRLLKSISTMALEREASTKEDNFPVYNVTAELGVRVKFIGTFDKIMSDIIVGKASADDYQAAYVRLPDSKRVLVAKSEVPVSYTLGVDYKTKQVKNENWVNKKVTALTADDIRRVELIRPDGKTVLENIRTVEQVPTDQADTPVKTEEKWTWWIIEPERIEAASDEVKKLTRTLANIYASDPVAKKDLTEYGLDSPDTRIVLEVVKKTEDAVAAEAGLPELMETIELHVGDPAPGNKCYFKRADAEEIFLLSGYTYQNMLPALEKLKPAPPETDTEEESDTATDMPPQAPMPDVVPDVTSDTPSAGDTAAIAPPRVLIPEEPQ